jgi:hypothetical protein
VRAEGRIKVRMAWPSATNRLIKRWPIKPGPPVTRIMLLTFTTATITASRMLGDYLTEPIGPTLTKPC